MRTSVALVLTSAAILLAELILIRWIPANVVYVGFFNNLILIASFLGIGVGILLGRRFGSYAAYAPLGLLLIVAVVLIAQVNVHADLGDVYIGYRSIPQVEPSLFVVGAIVALSTATMALLALPLAPLLTALRPLHAYAVDIAGSILGIAIFAAVSFLSTPPLVWIVALVLVLAGATLGRGVGRRDAIGALAMLAVIAIAAVDLQRGDAWSPYYRISMYARGDGSEAIAVNGIGHQALNSADTPIPVYRQVYDWFPERAFEEILILGAGAGNDTAVALARGARHVDAVEIDPVILRIGSERHPDRPYDDPRVTRIVADGRAFLRTTSSTYDLIVFGGADSLALVTNTANLRLESFLLTEEAFRDARARLRPDGVMVLWNQFREPWFVARYAAALERVFGSPAIVRTYPGEFVALATVMAVGRDGLPPVDGAQRWPTGDAPRPATDDWPFIYLREPGIQPSYAISLAGVLVFAIVAVIAAARAAGARGADPHFFLLGAAFLLLETRSLATFGLLFGTTWYVNALVFAAILASVLLAIVCTARLRLRDPRPLYAALFASLAAAYVLDPGALLFEPAWLRYAAASIVAFAPIFVANLVFARSFRDVAAADRAFAWNILGAVCGGVLEYVSLVTGYKQLLLLVAALYVGAALSARTRSDERRRNAEAVA